MKRAVSPDPIDPNSERRDGDHAHHHDTDPEHPSNATMYAAAAALPPVAALQVAAVTLSAELACAAGGHKARGEVDAAVTDAVSAVCMTTIAPTAAWSACAASCRVAWRGVIESAASLNPMTARVGERRLKVMSMALCQLSCNAGTGAKSTLRDLYYCLASHADHDQNLTNDAVQRIAAMLQRPRHALFINASAKGLMSGTIRWNDTSPSSDEAPVGIAGDLACLLDFCRGYLASGAEERTLWQTALGEDPVAALAGFHVSGPGLDPIAAVAYAEYLRCCHGGVAVAAAAGTAASADARRTVDGIPRSIVVAPRARCILVVEKDTVFQRLHNGRLWRRAPAVIVTGRGMPDIATRCVVRLLSLLFPSLPVVGLVDCNASGLAILCQYRFGGLRGCPALDPGVGPHWRSAHQKDVVAVPTMRWLGLWPSETKALRQGGTAPTARDKSMLATLLTAMGSISKKPAQTAVKKRAGGAPASTPKTLERHLTCAAWEAEVRAMATPGTLKYDIEALYAASNANAADLSSVEGGDSHDALVVFAAERVNGSAFI